MKGKKPHRPEMYPSPATSIRFDAMLKGDYTFYGATTILTGALADAAVTGD